MLYPLQVFKDIATLLGDYHGYFWMNKEMREKLQDHLYRADWQSGKNEAAYNNLVK